jgi:DNA replication protein DnaC
MIENLLEIMSKMPVLANAQAQYRAPEELAEEALDYVRSKWADAKMGDLRALSSDVLRVKRDEQLCLNCRGAGKCPLSYHPLILSADKYRDYTVYNVRAGECQLPAVLHELGKVHENNLIKASELTQKQLTQTFETYVTAGLGSEVIAAKGLARCAAENGEWLVLAGKRGTGKSHLAVAIMLEVMRRGIAALFQTVPEMLDELRRSYEDGSHYAKMEKLKNIPCLVLDDLGKERSTDAGLDYLHQIIDFRYRNERRQTIITTNALDQDELLKWSNSNYLGPLISRLNEMGTWCAIKKAADYRTALGKAKKLPMTAA